MRIAILGSPLLRVATRLHLPPAETTFCGIHLAKPPERRGVEGRVIWAIDFRGTGDYGKKGP